MNLLRRFLQALWLIPAMLMMGLMEPQGWAVLGLIIAIPFFAIYLIACLVFMILGFPKLLTILCVYLVMCFIGAYWFEYGDDKKA